MAPGVGKINTCPFCTKTMRSDHLRTHIQKIHRAALLEAPPTNWFKHGEHIIVRRREIKDSLGNKIQADKFPEGVCLNCACMLHNEVTRSLDVFDSHVCKEKQQRVRAKAQGTPSAPTSVTSQASPSWEEFWDEARHSVMSIRQPKNIDPTKFGENKVKLQKMFQTALDFSNEGDDETPNINYRDALLSVLRDLATEYVAPITASVTASNAVTITKVHGFEVSVKPA
jgi:hypothetical protein